MQDRQTSNRMTSAEPALGSIESARRMLQQRFGLEHFRPGQAEVIGHLLAGRSAAAVFPTGGGKSLCYQLPAMLLDGLTLVVSPLIALMKDQIDTLCARGIEARRLDSSLDANAYRDVNQRIRDGTLRLLYVAPERFNNERFRNAIGSVRIALFAVDEAHCISEWGHNFRPDYLKLVEFAKACNAERVLAVTATATKEVLRDICHVFQIAPECAINTGFYRPNLTLMSTAVDDSTRDQALLERIKHRPPSSAIVYVTLQKTAERVATMLNQNGAQAQHYHAGLGDSERDRVQDWFMRSDTGVVVATIAFGMGIDKSNIRYIYHYNLPKSLENYSQEIGRAGRDDAPSVCELFACQDDLIPLENFVYADTPTERAIQSLVRYVFEQETVFDVSLHALSQRVDIRVLVLRTLLTRLELQGYLSGGTPFYANYRFKPLVPIEDIVSRFNERRQAFLTGMFHTAQRAKSWFDIDLASSSEALGTTRDRLVSALDYLAEKDLLELKVAGVRNRYRLVRRPESTKSLADALVSDARRREELEIGRLHDVLAWVKLDQCQTSALTSRFEKPLEANCGHCSWCETRSPVFLCEREELSVDPGLLSKAKALKREHPSVLRGDVELARVLCGLSSPAISKARLQRTSLFAAAESVPYRRVLQQLESHPD